MSDVQDYLNAREKAQEIATEVIELFEKNKSEHGEGQVGYYSDQPSRMYAIYGGWGTGKTRVLEELQQVLERDKVLALNIFGKKFFRNQYEVVWFRPWEYEDEGSKVDQKLLAKILEKSSLPKKIWRSVTYIFRNFFVGIIIIGILMLTISPIRKFIVSELSNLEVDISESFILWILGVSTALLLAVFIVSPQKVLSSLNWMKFSIIDFHKAQNIFNRISNPSTKRDKIAKILRDSLGKDKKVFVFIDDLDRCRKETVINLLEHTKHFYSMDQLYFIYAVDREQISTFISEYYE